MSTDGGRSWSVNTVTSALGRGTPFPWSSPVLARLAAWVTRRRKVVLVGAALLFLVLGSYGGRAPTPLRSGGFGDPSSESFQADDELLHTFEAGTPNFVLVVTAKSGDVDAAATGAGGAAITKELSAEPHLTNVASYWSLGEAAPLR